MASAHVMRMSSMKRTRTPRNFNNIDEAAEYIDETKLLSAEKLLTEKVTKKKPGLFYPSSTFRENWDYFILVIAIWNALALPVELSLDPEVLRSTYNVVANVIIDICFFIDIVIIFRTAIYGSNMEIVTDTKQIAVAYLKGNFWIDFISTFPFDTMPGRFMRKELAERFKIFGIFKLIRVVRLNRIIRDLNSKRYVKTSLKIMKLTFFLMVYVHC